MKGIEVLLDGKKVELSGTKLEIVYPDADPWINDLFYSCAVCGQFYPADSMNSREVKDSEPPYEMFYCDEDCPPYEEEDDIPT